MPIRNVRRVRARIAALAALLSVALSTAPIAIAAAQGATPAPATRTLPDRLSDAEFWKLVAEISEPDAYFRIVDNFTSNEIEVGQLFTMLRNSRIQGDVYLGVGPEQNLTYIAAVRPRMAFIVDIRRQAVMQHLMFKAVFEMAKDRADFISLLFGIPRPAGLDSATPIPKMWDAYYPVASDTAAQARNYKLVVERLTRTHGFTFTPDESNKLRAVWDAFQYYGAGITTNGPNNGRGGGGNRTFADLTGYSTDGFGEIKSFLSSEENYRYVKTLHEKNLIVPVSGDFGGTHAIRAIGAYLKDHGGTLRAFYVSNVEQYLFGDGKQGAFYENLKTIPVDATSAFIRPYSMRRGGGGASVSLCPIAGFLRAFTAGRVYSNNDALACVTVAPQ